MKKAVVYGVVTLAATVLPGVTVMVLWNIYVLHLWPQAPRLGLVPALGLSLSLLVGFVAKGKADPEDDALRATTYSIVAALVYLAFGWGLSFLL